MAENKKEIEKKKHRILRKYRHFHSGDFYSFNIVCSCGEEFHKWTNKEVEEEFNKHKKGII